MGRLNRYIWFLIMIIIGGGIGLYYAWYIKPADFVDAAMFNLRQDYKTDFVLMAAEIYDQDHDRYHAMLRLDQILDQGETAEEAVRVAIRTAEGFGYNPIDLDKMHRLYEIVTGQRSTPTPQYDPTMAYSIQQTSTAVAISLNPSINNNKKNNDQQPGNESIPVDSDPFGTGDQAQPGSDIPEAPTVTPTPDIPQADENPFGT